MAPVGANAGFGLMERPTGAHIRGCRPEVNATAAPEVCSVGPTVTIRSVP